MADSATTDVGAQAQAVGADLLSELQAADSGSKTVADITTQTKQRIAQAAEDTYWAPRRQMEQGIASRKTQAASQQAEERIAQLKQQINA
jgi:hypothetical protein